MTENVKQFLAQLSADRDLAEKKCKMSKEEIIAAAKQRGISLTDADLKPDEEVSDAELSAVAGGKGCGCALGGGGVQGGKDDVCGCVGFGIGYDASYEKIVRCMCNVVGGGLSANDDEAEE